MSVYNIHHHHQREGEREIDDEKICYITSSNILCAAQGQIPDLTLSCKSVWCCCLRMCVCSLHLFCMCLVHSWSQFKSEYILFIYFSSFFCFVVLYVFLLFIFSRIYSVIEYDVCVCVSSCYSILRLTFFVRIFCFSPFLSFAHLYLLSRV